MRKISLFASLLVVFAFAISCASTPPQNPLPEAAQPEAAQPEAAQPEKLAVSAPDAELAQAKNLQLKIDTYGLAPYDAENYQTGTRDLKAGEDAFGTDNASSKKSLDSAISAFDAVIAKGAPLLVAQVQEQSEASKKAADDLLAAVAVKEDYAKADAIYQGALQEKSAGDLESAGKDFSEAQKLFDAVAEAAQKKKDVAMQSLQAAQQDLTSSEQKAADAQTLLQEEGIAVSGSGQ